MTRIELEEAAPDELSDERRGEWRTVAAELSRYVAFEAATGPSVLVIRAHPQIVDLKLHRDDEQRTLLAHVEVAREQLRVHIADYVDIVRRMSSSETNSASAHMEALDMAKKLTHDAAGRTMERLCRPLGADHETSRRLFSLLLSVFVDTTRLVGVHGHRPIRG